LFLNSRSEWSQESLSGRAGRLSGRGRRLNARHGKLLWTVLIRTERKKVEGVSKKDFIIWGEGRHTKYSGKETLKGEAGGGSERESDPLGEEGQYKKRESPL